jgi:hypothetical protein
MASHDVRAALIADLQRLRQGSVVITYITSTRPNLESQMAMDVIPVVHRHLEAIATSRDETRVDLFLHTNGGDGTVPWRLVTLIREFATRFSVLVPHHAFSAGTLVAMGADEVVMHPMGMLGPIDPTVTTPFNPPNPQAPNERLGISVEDVASYIALVKEDVGIRHEDELVQAFKILAEQVNPLALGSVKRSTSQARMMGDKLLRTRESAGLDDRSIAETVEKLASRLYYHGHPINREEARTDLGLGFIVDPSPDVAAAMWRLYEIYSDEMALEEPFNAVAEVTGGVGPNLPAPPQQLPTGQIIPSIPSVVRAVIGPYPIVKVESAVRADRFVVSLDAVVTRDWNGPINVNVSPLGQRWEEDL